MNHLVSAKILVLAIYCALKVASWVNGPAGGDAAAAFVRADRPIPTAAFERPNARIGSGDMSHPDAPQFAFGLVDATYETGYRDLRKVLAAIRSVIVDLAAADASGTATALESPRPEEMLVEQSEVVVEGRVLGVTLEEIESRESGEFRVFRAWLAVESVIKGDFPAGETLEVIFRSIRPGTPTVGGFADAGYLPGERVRAFLTWGFEGSEGWATVHWSGKRTLELSEKKLPGAVGQSVMLDDSTAHRPGCEAKGGRWLPLYKVRRYRVCVLPTQDAGRSCTDSRQCEGYCLAERELAPRGQAAPARCSDRAPLGGGCWNIVSEGMATGMACSD